MSDEQNIHIFGTDGVRGRANQFPMLPEIALALGRAVGKMLRCRSSGRPRVVIGKDTRLSGYLFENALVSGLCSMGVDTLLLGPYPTPGVAFITHAYRADAGIVISASHNPYYDNGIKFFDSEGFKMSDSCEKELEAMVLRNDFYDCLPSDGKLGRNTKITDADGRYIEFVKAMFPRGKSLKNLKIVLDCGNGASYKVAPLVLKELDAKVFSYGIQPDGLNINLNSGSLYPGNVQKGIIDFQADAGVALDGDGDRVVMVDENAQVINGDTLLAICARDLFNRKLLKNNLVVGTVMSHLGFIKAMETLGINVIKSQVGDRYVIQEMLAYDANLGGDQRGHVIFLDHNTTGDGLVCALQVLRIMVETGTKLSDLVSFVHRYPEMILNVRVALKPPLELLEKVQQEIRKAEQVLGPSGRVLVRYSGTESVCRVVVEGIQHKQIIPIAQKIAQSISEEIGEGNSGYILQTDLKG